MEENILKELVKSKKILKKKFQSIRLGELEKFNNLERTFKPLTEPLKKLVKLSDSSNLTIPIDEKHKCKHNTKIKTENKTIFTSTPKKNLSKEKNINSAPNRIKIDKEEEEEDYNSNSEDEVNDKSKNEQFYSQSSDWEFDLSTLNGNKKLDTIFGPHKMENGDWKFGNSILKLTDDKIIIGQKSWALTPGLYSLLFHKNPKQFDSSELAIYKHILLDTNAHRRNYDPNNQINGNRGYKYKKIINKLFTTTTHVGKGLMEVNLNKPNYIYWDNPNEIVDRLRLLIASQHAGNNNHSNEIISIVEELREANIIE